jgi:adenine-specific DNA-methyltransferase
LILKPWGCRQSTNDISLTTFWYSASLTRFSVESLDQAEDHLIFAATTDGDEILDMEVAARLLTLPGEITGQAKSGPDTEALEATAQQRQAAIQRGISERNARFFEAEADKLDGWADDLKVGLEREIKELDRQIKEARRAATTALTLEEKLGGAEVDQVTRGTAQPEAALAVRRAGSSGQAARRVD